MSPDEKSEVLVGISQMVDAMEACGSRVTCNPAPTDTDEDYLLLIEYDDGGSDGPAATRFSNLQRYLHGKGWERGGSLPADTELNVGEDERFESWTFDQLNLIITESRTFYKRFMAATHVAKQLNLMDKTQRIMLFQAVLYGNVVEAA